MKAITRAVVEMAIVANLVSSTHSQILIDDFNDGHDDGWTRGDMSGGQPWGPGIFDASSGEYLLENSSTLPMGTFLGILESNWNGSSDPLFSNGFVRATVNVGTDSTVAGLSMRRQTTGAGAYLFLGNADDGTFLVQVGENFGVTRTEVLTIDGFPFRPGENWFLEAGAMGNELSLKAWRADQLEPDSPQLVFKDETFTAGVIGVTAAHNLSLTTPGKAVARFDDITFALGGPTLPGDYDENGVLTVEDIDTLSAEIFAGTNNSAIDLTGDGVVDDGDLKTWLSVAAGHNGFSQSYLVGDSNLDGSVNAIDLNNLALSWLQDDEPRWSGGDFNADGSVSVLDLNELALSWQQTIPMASTASAPVPEPSALLLAVFGLLLVRRRPRCS